MDHTTEYRDSLIGRRLKLRDLHVFFAVVQWGSMARAARHLSMSQPAVSKVISDLEAALRVRLLDRGSRGIEPTVYGHALLKHGNAAFDELRLGIRNIEFLADPTAGEVSIGSQELMAAGLLPAVIDRLSRRYPKIVVHVRPNVSILEFRGLRERKIDVVLARIPKAFTADDLDIEILFDDPQEVVVAGIKSRWARRRKVRLEELVDEPWVLPPNEVVTALMTEAFKATGLGIPQRRVTSPSLLLRNQLLATGRFISVLPSFVARQNAKQWGLKTLPIDLGVTPRSVAIVTLKDRSVSPVVRLFLEHVRAVAKTMFASSSAAARVKSR